jgi:hypothetical protein
MRFSVVLACGASVAAASRCRVLTPAPVAIAAAAPLAAAQNTVCTSALAQSAVTAYTSCVQAAQSGSQAQICSCWGTYLNSLSPCFCGAYLASYQSVIDSCKSVCGAS